MYGLHLPWRGRVCNTGTTGSTVDSERYLGALLRKVPLPLAGVWHPRA